MYTCAHTHTHTHRQAQKGRLVEKRKEGIVNGGMWGTRESNDRRVR